MYLCGGDVNGEDCVWEEGIWELYLLNASVNLKQLCKKKSLKIQKNKNKNNYFRVQTIRDLSDQIR